MFGVEMGDFPPSDSRSVVSDSLDPMDWSPPGSSVHGILQVRMLEWVAPSFFPGDLSDPGIEPRCPALQADSLLSKPPGKPKKYTKVFKNLMLHFDNSYNFNLFSKL